MLKHQRQQQPSPWCSTLTLSAAALFQPSQVAWLLMYLQPRHPTVLLLLLVIAAHPCLSVLQPDVPSQLLQNMVHTVLLSNMVKFCVCFGRWH